MAYYALKKDVFDINKVTVVGSPTITSDGIASGFGKDNYITIQQINFGSATWKYEMTFETGSNVSSEQWVVNSINVGTRNITVVNELVNGVPKIRVRCYVYNTSTSSYNSIQGTFNSFPNTKFNVSIEFDGINSYTFKCNDETQKVTNSYKVTGVNQILLGKRYPTDTTYFSNSDLIINLPSFKIYVDDQLVFQPVKPTYLLERRKEGYDSSKFTVVGSPTITSNGVASGFSSKSSGTENYLTLPTVFNPQDKSWKIIIKATIGEWVSGSPYKSLLGTGIQGRDNQGVALALATGNSIACWLSSTGTGWNIGTIRTSFPDIIGNTYYFKIEFTGAKYELSYSENKINWNILGSIESSTPIYVSSQPLAIGDNKYNNAASTCWTGSIDLPSTSITVDGKEVFTGAKEVYYAMEK